MKLKLKTPLATIMIIVDLLWLAFVFIMNFLCKLFSNSSIKPFSLPVTWILLALTIIAAIINKKINKSKLEKFRHEAENEAIVTAVKSNNMSVANTIASDQDGKMNLF